MTGMAPGGTFVVSTHSRPKAAGSQLHRARCGFGRFNTQPPEGGWLVFHQDGVSGRRFQHTAARRRLDAKVAL